MQNGFELKEIHDVDVLTNTPTNNQALVYESSSSLWKNKTIDKTFVGLSNVDNTSDANKPVSTAQATAIGLKYDATNPSGFISNINSLISQGTNVTITGSGTIASPYVISASGGGGASTPAIRKAQPRITRETYY